MIRCVRIRQSGARASCLLPVLPSWERFDSMTDQDFDFIRKLLRDRSAITLEDGKQYLVESRLAPLVRELKLDSIGRPGRPAALAALQWPAAAGRRGHGDHRDDVLPRPAPVRGAPQVRDPGAGPQTPERAVPEHLVRGLLHRAGAVQPRPLVAGAFPGAGVAGRSTSWRPTSRGTCWPARARGVTARSRSTAVCPPRSW